MHTEWITSFLVVAEELNLTHAAERLNISGSALSRQIGDLEKALCVELLVRDSNSVALTPAGLALAKHAPDALRQVEELVQDVRSGKGQVR